MTERITLDAGNGGKKSHSLIGELVLPFFDNPILSKLDDSAVFNIKAEKLAFSTDSYVVDPVFFPGGNIGDLSINGTVNDIATSGATPLYLSVGMIIEEGFLISDLKKILNSMSLAAKEANVKVVTGDFKVVNKGKCDKIFINTSGIGIINNKLDISGSNAKKNDKIIITGNIANHGICVLMQREKLNFSTIIKTDSAPLNSLIKEALNTSKNIHVLRDPTRGGVATTLNEISMQSNVSINIFEDALPIQNEVKGACEFLGFDPLYLANEGKMLLFVEDKDAEGVLSCIRKNKFGKDAQIIGEVTDELPAKVYLKTKIGGKRIIDMLTGEQLPRIC